MSELKFNRVNHEKHNTTSIYIENGSLTLKENFEIDKVEKTKWKFQKVTLKLTDQDLIEKIKSWETEINEHLKSEGVGPLTIIYGNKIYLKISLTTSTKKKSYNLNFRSIWINKENKPFIQHWLE